MGFRRKAELASHSESHDIVTFFRYKYKYHSTRFPMIWWQSFSELRVLIIDKKVYHLIIWSDNQARKAQKIPKLGQLSCWNMIFWKASEHRLKWTCPGPSDQGWSIWQRCLSMFSWMFELLWMFSNLIFWEIRSVRQSSHVYKGFQMIEMEKAKRERATPNQGLILFTIILDRDLSIVVFV